MKMYILLIFAFVIINKVYLLSFNDDTNLKIENTKDSILAEGIYLYDLERSSWLSTDVIRNNTNLLKNIRGYFSYKIGDTTKTIYYNDVNEIEVLATFTFDKEINLEQLNTSYEKRDMTKNEFELYNIRNTTLNLLSKDTLFKFYPNTSFNIIPINYLNNKKVYIITGPKVENLLILGNDYVINFNDDNQIINYKNLHNDIIQLDFNELNKKYSKIETTMHTHNSITGDFITPTDVCTLLLYYPYLKVDSHMLFGENYITMFNLKIKNMMMMKKELFEQIYKK